MTAEQFLEYVKDFNRINASIIGLYGLYQLFRNDNELKAAAWLSLAAWIKP